MICCAGSRRLRAMCPTAACGAQTWPPATSALRSPLDPSRNHRALRPYEPHSATSSVTGEAAPAARGAAATRRRLRPRQPGQKTAADRASTATSTAPISSPARSLHQRLVDHAERAVHQRDGGQHDQQPQHAVAPPPPRDPHFQSRRDGHHRAPARLEHVAEPTGAARAGQRAARGRPPGSRIECFRPMRWAPQ